MAQPSISMVIPAYNEEDHLRITVETTLQQLKEETKDFEIIVINDGSKDNTGRVTDELKQAYPEVTVIHNPVNRGFGYSCQRGVDKATKEYVGWVPADTVWDTATLKKVLGMLGEADIIATYMANFHERPFLRRKISQAFTGTLNLLFGLRLKYYNGGCFHKTRLLQSQDMISQGLTYWAEALIRMIKSGCSFRQTDAYFAERSVGQSKAFRINNIFETGKFIVMLIFAIYFKKRHGPVDAGK